jgi:Asp-tRNA(Asn)/Glu-tRNA(Gln) amidotransferase A subunit family amidase
VRRAAAALADAGHDIVEAAPPAPREVRAAFDTMMMTELAVLAADHPFDEAQLSRYGRMLAEARHFPADVRSYVAAAVRLADLEATADAWFDVHPIALCPTVPVSAPVASEGITTADGTPMNPGGKLTLCTYANALGLPAVSVPAGRDADGLPVAVQVIGRRACDLDVIAIAEELDRSLGGWLDPADATAAGIARAG